MKINLFTDKQAQHLAQSVKPAYKVKFREAVEELESLVDAEVQRQIETSEDIIKYKTDRDEGLAKGLEIAKIAKQIGEISDVVKISTENRLTSRGRFSWQNEYIEVLPDITSLINTPEATSTKWNDTTDKRINEMARDAAIVSLNLNKQDKRFENLMNDVVARLAVMGANNTYDEAVTKLESVINISDYFQTL
jgi:hypothetical protein